MVRRVAQTYRSEILLIALLMAMLVVIVLSVADVFAGAARTNGAPWADDIHTVADALVAGHVRAADRAWQHARRAALGSRRWDGMLAVGDRLGMAQ